jgi:hypothetical protein
MPCWRTIRLFTGALFVANTGVQASTLPNDVQNTGTFNLYLKAGCDDFGATPFSATSPSCTGKQVYWRNLAL